MSHPIRNTAVLLVVLLAACERPQNALGPEPPDQARSEKIGPGVLEALRRGETPAIMVALEAAATGDLVAMRRQAARLQLAALDRVTEDELVVRRRYAVVPAFAARARSEDALVRLAADPTVRRIDLDVGGTGSLGASLPVIQADLRHVRGNRGDGVVVAILDSGIDSDHPDLADALIHEACFGDNNNSVGDTGFCPNGNDRQTGPGAAEDDAGHGTHVSGIVGSNGTVSGAGVAPDVDIVAIKVLDNCSFAGCFSAFSEIVAALDYILNNPGLGVQVINMSLGTGALFTDECDNAAAFTMAGAAAVNMLRANGVITFASAGNNGSSTQMTAPACLSNVVSVGATNNNDVIAGFSNGNSTLDILAPGVSITSLAIGGGTTGASGTSMASPHAAGCAALLIHAGDATTPDDIETRLKNSPVQITDTRNNFTFPRISCLPDDNQAPTLTVANATVTVNEGSAAANSGTFSDPDGDAVALTASIGTVTDAGGGAWTWSFSTTDGPAQSQNVTITATDALDAATSVSFALNVLNVAPIVDAGADATITSSSLFTLTGSFSDPGVNDAPWNWTIDWGDGTQTSGSTSNQALQISASHTFCAAQDYTVTLSVTDKDNGVGTDQLTLSVAYLAVQIDITPTQQPNSINLGSQGLLPVAVLGSATFDATAIDPASVVLGDEAGSDTPVALRNNGMPYATVEDVNGDGVMDMVFHFRVPALVANGDLTAGSTSLVLRGFLRDGCTNFRGTDAVRIVPG